MDTRSNYDKYPTKYIKNYDKQVWQGYESIINEITSKSINRNKVVVVVDCYMGVDLDEIYSQFSKLGSTISIRSDDIAISSEAIDMKVKEFLTYDRVFGVMNTKVMKIFLMKVI